MKSKKTVLFFTLLCIGFVSLFSQEEKEPAPWGFVFNADNLFLDLESYQAGVGIKILKEDDKALRFLGDLFYSNSSNSFSATLGVTWEKHFRPGRVSPYWGWFLQAGFISQTTEVDADNWTRSNSYPLSGGGVLGVEFFILEFLSVFAEYAVEVSGTISTSTASVVGVETKADPDFSYSLDTGIGNESKLGITIYLDDIVKIEKK